MFNRNFIYDAIAALRALSSELGSLQSVGPGHAEAASAKLTQVANGLETGAQVVGEAQAALAKPSVETIAPIAETVATIAAPGAAPLVAAGVAIAEAIEHALESHPSTPPAPAAG